MTDGSALLTALIHGLRAAGQWQDRAGANLIDGGSPWYDAYETADGKWVAIGALEPQFRAVLLDKLGLSGDDPDLKATLDAPPSANIRATNGAPCSKAATPASRRSSRSPRRRRTPTTRCAAPSPTSAASSSPPRRRVIRRPADAPDGRRATDADALLARARLRCRADRGAQGGGVIG